LPAARITAVNVSVRVVFVVANALVSRSGAPWSQPTARAATSRDVRGQAVGGTPPHTTSPSAVSVVGAKPMDRATAADA